MSDPAVGEVLTRLATSKLGDDEKDLVSKALFPQAEESRDDDPGERVPAARASDEATRRLFIESIRVRGFRGIGDECQLALSPHPGLTLVTGRNGTGKSSIVEGVEFVLTGQSLRWAGRSVERKAGWRNLHSPAQPQAVVTLQRPGLPEPHIFSATWDGDNVEKATRTVSIGGTPTRPIETPLWDGALATHRPILSYAELAKIVEGTPSDRYNALAPVLGMQSLQAPLNRLGESKKLAEQQHEAGVLAVKALLPDLQASADDRALRAYAALDGPWDLDAVDDIVTGTQSASTQREQVLRELEQLAPPNQERVIEHSDALKNAARQVSTLEGTEAGRADVLAELLRSAIRLHELHGDGDCPVCGRDSALHSDWVQQAKREIERLKSVATKMRTAQSVLETARRGVHSLAKSPPEVLTRVVDHAPQIDASGLTAAWNAWATLPNGDEELADHLLSGYEAVERATVQVRTAARSFREEQDADWRPLAQRLSEVLPLARESEKANKSLPGVGRAEKWLKDTEAEIRDGEIRGHR
ncbi:MAG: AAA family ATPase [Acidimicrobiaceae bacterium]|nr:AAA family ATPase [Acidimicrobiaceae bacterium]